MFAGIGTGIIALKRLGITMKKIIHVEHDLVANHGEKSSLFPFEWIWDISAHQRLSLF
jgi:hypothetical protein